MLESLSSLSKELSDLGGHLFCFEGETEDILDRIHKSHKIKSVAFNMDVTPFAKKRDASIFEWCKSHLVTCESEEDYTFHSVHSIRTKTGTPYQMFSPFKNTCLALNVKELVPFPSSPKIFVTENELNVLEGSLGPDEVDGYAPEHEEAVAVYGGRDRALAILDRIANGEFENYENGKKM